MQGKLYDDLEVKQPTKLIMITSFLFAHQVLQKYLINLKDGV